MSRCVKPTAIERIVNLFPGPYALKCAAFASVFGLPLLLVTRFLDSVNIQNTLAVFGGLSWQNFATFSIANFVLVFYGAYGIRYMRSRIESTMNELEPVTSENRKTFEKVFSPVCKLYPAIILSVLIFAAVLISFPTQAQHASGTFSILQVGISYPFVYLTYGTFIWVYASSVKSIHDLGKQAFLPLSEFYDDPHLGMKPLGNLSLSLAFIYFVGLVLVFFSFTSIPIPLEVAVWVLILSGIVLFFLPLNAIHQKMKRRKREESEKLRAHYRQLKNPLEDSMSAGDMRRILAVDIIDRQVASIPEWPLDFRTVTWLSAIVLTVLVSIITRYVMLFLGL